MARPNTRAHVAARKSTLYDTPESLLDGITNTAGPIAGALLACNAAGLDNIRRSQLVTAEASARGLAAPVFLVDMYPSPGHVNTGMMVREATARTNGGRLIDSPKCRDCGVRMFVPPGDTDGRNLWTSRWNSSTQRERLYLAGRNEFALALIADGHPASQRLRESFGIR